MAKVMIGKGLKSKIATSCRLKSHHQHNLGINKIQKNLNVNIPDMFLYCKQKLQNF